VLLIAGPAHAEEMRRLLGDTDRALRVRVEGFVDRIDLAYAAADLVVARAGASSIAEVAACGLPVLLVPYPHATAGHQEANARAMQRAGGAAVLRDDELSAESLAGRIAGLMDHRERLAAMSERSLAFAAPDATAQLADAVEDVAK
jgi:UDP-N-acetylglucosamine--N-acetylmuramyl-(pentapeptide) pyrophosphoryl-undecaprenol N-acetylglucosamine transferase